MKVRLYAALLPILLAGCRSERPAAPVVVTNAGPVVTTPVETAPAGPAATEAPSQATPNKPAAMPAPRTVIPEGTPIAVRVIPTLSTKTSAAGDAFEATLARPLVVNGETVAPRGARVTGKVVEADDGGRVKGRARIAVRVTGIELGGRMTPVVTSSYAKAAKGTKAKDARNVGIGAGIGAAIGAIAGGGAGAAIGAGAGAGAGGGYVLATRGAAASIPSETVITVKLRNKVTV